MSQDAKLKVNFEPVVSESELATVEEMARTIWNEHYTPIIGKEQVNYMLDKFQSVAAMKEQIEAGYLYFIMIRNGQTVGYLSIVKRDQELFLSKVYVDKKYRRLGIGKAALGFVENTAAEKGCSIVALTVNKNNFNSIRAYEKAGFFNKGSVVMDIGEGFVMDDYKFEKEIGI